MVHPAAGIRDGKVNALLDAAVGIQNLLDRLGWRYCIIGGIALLRWGDARLTRDVDLALLTGFGREDEFTIPLLDAGYVGRNRVLLVTAPNGVPVDISLAALPFEARAVDRATHFEFAPGCSLKTCSAEDLLVFKLFAFRPQDLVDVESVASKWGPSLDWDYVEENLAPLAELKETPAIMRKLAGLQRTHERS